MSAIRFYQIMKQMYRKEIQLNRDIIREITSTDRRFGGISIY